MCIVAKKDIFECICYLTVDISKHVPITTTVQVHMSIL